MKKDTLLKFLDRKIPFGDGLLEIINTSLTEADSIIIFQSLKERKKVFQKNNPNLAEVERFFCLLLWLTWKYPTYCSQQKELDSFFREVYSFLETKNKGSGPKYSFIKGIEAGIEKFKPLQAAALEGGWGNVAYAKGIASKNSWVVLNSPTTCEDYQRWFSGQNNRVLEEQIAAYFFGALPEDRAFTEIEISFTDFLEKWEEWRNKFTNEAAIGQQAFAVVRFLRFSLYKYLEEEQFISWLNREEGKYIVRWLGSSNCLNDLPNLADIKEKCGEKLEPKHPLKNYLASEKETSVRPSDSTTSFSLSDKGSDTEKVGPMQDALNTVVAAVLPIVPQSAGDLIRKLSSASEVKEPSPSSSPVQEGLRSEPPKLSSEELDRLAQQKKEELRPNIQTKIEENLLSPSRGGGAYDATLHNANLALVNRLLDLHPYGGEINYKPIKQLIDCVPLKSACVSDRVKQGQSQDDVRLRQLQANKNRAWQTFCEESWNWGNFSVKREVFLKEISQLEIQYAQKSQSLALVKLKTPTRLTDCSLFENDEKVFYEKVRDFFNSTSSFFSSPTEFRKQLDAVKTNLQDLVNKDTKLSDFINNLKEVFPSSPDNNYIIPQEVSDLFQYFESEIARYQQKAGSNSIDWHATKRLAQLQWIKIHCLYLIGSDYLSSNKSVSNKAVPIQSKLATILQDYAHNHNVHQCKPGTIKSMLCCFYSTTANQLNAKAVDLRKRVGSFSR